MRRFIRLSAALAAVSLTSLVSQGSASAAPLPAAYSASAAAQVMLANETGTFLGTPLRLTDVSVADSLATANSTATPRTVAAGSNLTLGTPIAGLTVNQIQQTAPPTHAAATKAALLTVNSPDLSASALNASVQARWAGERICPAAGTPLSTTSVSTAGIDVGLDVPPAPVANRTATAAAQAQLRKWITSASQNRKVQPNVAPGDPTLVSTGVGRTSTTTSLPSIAGPRDSRGVRARASSSVASIDLLGNAGDPAGTAPFSVSVARQPSLTATATGTAATSSLVFVPPTVSLSVLGVVTPIPANGGYTIVLATPSPGDPGETLNISVGKLLAATNTGTVVSGAASLLTVTYAGELNGTFAIAPMIVRATAPRTAIQCAAPAPVTPTPTPTHSGTGTAPLANTGSSAQPVGLLGVALLLLGAGILVIARRRRISQH